MPLSIAFIWSSANLLSGGVGNCLTIGDASCTGGIAELLAFRRHYAQENQTSLVVNRLDFATPFVQMHPLGRGLNRLILYEYLGFEVYYAFRSLLGQTREVSPSFERDIRNLSSLNIRPLLGNIGVSTANPWNQFSKHIHFDRNTGIALLAIDGADEDGDLIGRSDVVRVDQVSSAKGLLDFIHVTNEANKCTDDASLSTYNQYLFTSNHTSLLRNSTALRDDYLCWIPIIAYVVPNDDHFKRFLDAIVEYEHAPALILQTASWSKEPIRQVGTKGVWVANFFTWVRGYHQWTLTLSEDRRSIVNVTLIEDNLANLPDEARDEEYARDFEFINTLREEAGANDPIVGESGFMPNANFDIYRPCMGGECPIGNLFTDAMRWGGDADFAFTNSGGVRGQGWQSGPVRTSYIWEALPFPNTLCTGVMTGLSVFRLFNFSTSAASFETQYTDNGDRLLQVAGVRVTYNTKLERSRLVRVEMWNRETYQYETIKRLNYYKFATDSWSCAGDVPYPSLLGSELIIPGEQPGRTGSVLIQTIVSDYLSNLSQPYDTSIQGRLVNDTSISVAMDWIQTKDSCNAGEFWDEEFRSCLSCPTIDSVEFTESQVNFTDISGSTELIEARVTLVNDDDKPVSVVLKSHPLWIQFQRSTDFVEMIEPGRSITVDFSASSLQLEPGTAQGTVSFGVLDGGRFPGCLGKDATFEVILRAIARPEIHKPGSVVIVGFIMFGIIVVGALVLMVMVHRYREHRVVKSMQPEFLMVICFGVLVVASTIVPMSIENAISSQSGRDKACMATPWLLSMGFTLVTSALYAKLRRINTLFHSGFRRTTVTLKAAGVPFITLFGVNSILLTIWNVVDPPRWEIRRIENDESNLYGTCSGYGRKGFVFFCLTVGFNFVALLLVCYEAYRARDISTNYSESANLGLAILSWIQILIVGGPVLFLISEDNPTPKYFVQAAMIFVACFTMLAIIFGPVFARVNEVNYPETERTKSIRVSGLNMQGLSAHTRQALGSGALSAGSAPIHPHGSSSMSFKHSKDEESLRTSENVERKESENVERKEGEEDV